MSNSSIPICDHNGVYTMVEGDIPIPVFNPLLSINWPIGGGFTLEVESENHSMFIDLLSSSVLAVQELTKCYWNPGLDSLHIEYASKPLEFSVPIESYHIVKDGRAAACEAACEAYNRFPALFQDEPFQDEQIEDLQMITIFDDRRWHKSEIRVYFNPLSRKYLIHFNRLTGDRSSFNYTWGRILTEILQKTQMDTSKEYVGFMKNFNDLLR